MATAMATASATAKDRRMFHVYNNLARLSNHFVSFLASVHLEVLQKKRKNVEVYHNRDFQTGIWDPGVGIPMLGEMHAL
jgi:hypothetical protein